MDASLFGTFKICLFAVLYPLPGILLVIKPDGPDSTGRITCLTRFGTWSLLAQQAA
jgi:hypothetical protein